MKVEFNSQGLNLWCLGQAQGTMPGPPSQQTHISAQWGMSCPCQVAAQVRSQHSLSATMYLYTGLNDNSYLTPSSCLISLGASVTKVCSIKTPYTGSHSTEQKSCCWPQNAHPKFQRVHHNYFMLLSLTPTKKSTIFLVLNYVNYVYFMGRTIFKRNGHKQKAWKQRMFSHL